MSTNCYSRNQSHFLLKAISVLGGLRSYFAEVLRQLGIHMLWVQPKASGQCGCSMAASGPGYCWQNEKGVYTGRRKMSKQRTKCLFSCRHGEHYKKSTSFHSCPSNISSRGNKRESFRAGSQRLH